MKIKQIEDIKISSPKDSQVLIYDEDIKKFVNGNVASVDEDPNTIAVRTESGQLYAKTGIDSTVDEHDIYQVVNKDYLRKKGYANVDNMKDIIVAEDGVSVESKKDSSGNDKLFISAKVDNESVYINDEGELSAICTGNVSIDNVTIVHNDSMELSVPIDNETLKINDEGKLYSIGGGSTDVNENTFVFEGDLTTMYPIGKINASLKSPVTIPTAGKTFKEVWDMIFYEEKNPIAVLPSLTISGTSPDAEIGMSFSVNLGLTLKAGSYTYGPVSAITAADSYHSIYGEEEFDGRNFYISGFITEDDQYVYCSADYSADTVIPLTNIGNPYPSVQIQAGTATNTFKIKAGYRRIFYGYSDYKTMEELDGDKIRAIGESKVKAVKGTLPVLLENTVADTIIVAVPAELSSKIKVVMPSSSFADVTTEFIKQSGTISVAAANGVSPIDYNIWIYDPAKMDGTYQITVE